MLSDANLKIFVIHRAVVLITENNSHFFKFKFQFERL